MPDILDFKTDRPVHFNYTGKFEAPDENWIHMTRILSDFELIVMTEGTLYIAEDDVESTVTEGEYRLICPTNYQHGTRPSGCKFYWMHFSYNDFRNDPQRLSAIPASASERESHVYLPVQGKIPRTDRLIVQFKQLQDCNQKYGSSNFNNYLATAILFELYSQLFLSRGRNSNEKKDSQLYADINDYISWRLRENIRVSEIAEYFGYNAKYITTFFKKCSGVSLKQYILNQKIELAKAMLSDTNEPISQIGYQIGFEDNHNFSNTFKRLTGQSPSEYRNAYAERMLFHK